MASVVTVVSRFCYRSPTRPLFVAGLIFLILITWKFLVAQPDANALIMHSRDSWVNGQKQIRPEQLHVPMKSPVKKDESRRRLVNKLHNKEGVEESDKREKLDESGGYSSKESEGETEDGGRLEHVRIHVKQNRPKQSLEERKMQSQETIFLEKMGKNSVSNGREQKEMVKGGSEGSQEKERKNIKQALKSGSINQSQHSFKRLKDVSLSNNTLKSPKATTTNTQNDFPVGDYNILLTLVKMSPHSPLAKTMKKFLKSLCRYTSVKLTIHVVVDELGQMVVEEFFKGVTGICKVSTQVVIHDVNKLINQLKSLTQVLQAFFSPDKNSYYSDPIFFMSTALHKIFPAKLKRIIMMDVDLRFVTDIKPLFGLFDNFKDSNIMGLAREQSPVYRHMFYSYRMAHKNTRVGDPPPYGITGFNSGVVLFNLENMRKSTTYNNILEGKQLIKQLSEKYQFRGHLGDQDFFTLLSVEYPELFYTVSCSWNRQLCTWWRDNGYADIFDLYFNCSEPIHVYHGNCRTPILVDQEGQ